MKQHSTAQHSTAQHSTAQHSTARNSYFDFLRGVAIIFVIGIHTPDDVLSFNSICGETSIIIRQIIGCAVPIFLAISGFFIGKKQIQNKTDYFKFLKKQIPKIYIPYLIFALPHLLLYLHGGGGVMKALLYYLLCGLSVYYFVALIIQMYILSPIINNISKAGLLGWSVVSILSCCLITFIMQIKGITLPLLVYAGLFPTLIIYFALGVYIAKNGVTNVKMWLTVAALGLLLNYVESYFLHQFSGGGFGLKPSVYIYSFALIMVLFSNQAQALYNKAKNVFTQSIVKIGRVSFTIYLSHMAILLLFRKSLEFMPDWINCWSVRWLGTLFLTYIVIIIIKTIIPKTYHCYFGIY